MIYDHHVHTHYSSDCSELMEYYFVKAKSLGLNKVCFTDHIDFEVPYLNYKDRIYDVAKARDEIKELGEKYSIKGLLGVEMGYRVEFEERVRNYLENNHFDVVMLSIHQDCDYSFSKITRHYSVDRAAQIYFKALNNLLDSEIDFDILTHIDFFFRYIDRKEEYLNYASEYTKVLKKLIKLDKILEINTGSIKYFGNYDFYEFVLKIYKNLDGKNISVGSDSHELESYKLNFDKVFSLLKAYGFDEIILVENRQRTKVKI